MMMKDDIQIKNHSRLIMQFQSVNLFPILPTLVCLVNRFMFKLIKKEIMIF